MPWLTISIGKYLFDVLEQGWETPGTRALLFGMWARPRKWDPPPFKWRS